MEKDTQRLSDAEHRAAVHDLLCRLAAVTVSCPRHWCRLRRCRREGICRGALRPIDTRLPPVLLPPCISDRDAPPMAAFRVAFAACAKELEQRVEHGSLWR